MCHLFNESKAKMKKNETLIASKDLTACRTAISSSNMK